MHIILVSSKLAKPRSLTLTNRHLVAGAVFMALLVFSLTLGLFWITVRHANEVKLPLLDSLVSSAQEAQRRKTEEFLRENLNAMAVELGQMQAEEHTSELQSPCNLVCRLLLEKKKKSKHYLGQVWE